MGNRKIDTRKSIRVITLNNFVTAAGLENISLKARKLLYVAIAQCRMNDEDFYEYSISVREFSELMGIDASNVYKEADALTDELMHGFIKYIPEDKKNFKKFQLFAVCEYTEKEGIKFQLSRDMTPILLKLKENYLQPYLDDFIRMRSNYSIEIWHLMQREMRSKKPGVSNVIEFDLELKEMRQVTGTWNKLKQLSQFKERVLDKAIREISDNCGVIITYSNIKAGRTVTGFHFHAVSPIHVDETQVSQRTRDKVAFFQLKQEAKIRNLTLEEKKEYDRLAAVLGRE